MQASPGDADVAAAAKLLGDETRAAICAALLDGSAHTAGELARAGGVSPSTASGHLSLLVDGGLLTELRQGRCHFFRLAGPEVAHAVEALAVIAPPTTVTSLRRSDAARALRSARTCYDHLAGRLGIALTDALVRSGAITTDFTPGDLSALGELAVAPPDSGRRPWVRPCLDWSERRFHAAGLLPAQLLRELFALGWLERTPVPRAVRLTSLGERGLADLFGLEVDRHSGQALEPGRSAPASAAG